MAERDTRTLGPLVLDANAADNWRKFFMQFEIYIVAKGKDEKPDKLKVNMLLVLDLKRLRNTVILFTMKEKRRKTMLMYARNLRNSAKEPGM